VAHETLRDRARAMAQLRTIWHCEIFDTTPAARRFLADKNATSGDARRFAPPAGAAEKKRSIASSGNRPFSPRAGARRARLLTNRLTDEVLQCAVVSPKILPLSLSLYRSVCLSVCLSVRPSARQCLCLSRSMRV